MFINDNFINDLVWNTTKPKSFTEQLRQASVGPRHPNDHFKRQKGENLIIQKDGELPTHGGKADRGKMKRKLINSKNPKVKNAAERTLRQHFKTPITFDMFETELQAYLKESNFTPEYCCYTTCFDPTGPEPPIMFNRQKHTAFNNRRTPFNLGGLGGLPMGLTAMKAVANQCPPGGRVVVVYGTHIGIDERGSLGAVDLHDKKTDVYFHVQSCEAVVKMYKRLVNFGVEKAMESCQEEMYDLGFYKLYEVLKHHVHNLNYTSEEPYVHLPYIMYNEQRKRLLRIVEKAVDGKAMMVGFVRILTPPSNDDYVIIKNVDIVKPRTMRDVKQKVVNNDKEKQENNTARRDSKSKLGKAKLQGDDDELNLKVVYKDQLDEEDWLIDRTPQFRSRCIRVAREKLAKEESERAMRDSINNLKDRERAKRLETLHAKAKQIRTDDDWNIDRSKGDPVALQKMRGLAMYFRWSRMVRRLLNVVRLKEVDNDWNLNPETRADARIKFGKLFMVMRWKSLMHKFLDVHNRRERKELLRYY